MSLANLRAPHPATRTPAARTPATRAVASRTVGTLLATAALLGATACAGPGPAAPPPSTPTPTSAVPHGYVAGAAEVAEPQLQLATVNAAGDLSLLDLLGGTENGVTTLDQVSGLSTDGRYVFAAAAERGSVTIVDTGVWTVDHEDHQHYYRADPAVLGVVTDAGAGVVSGGGSLTTVRFAETGTGIILDHAALGDGSITELGRIEGPPGVGVLVPLGDRVLSGRTDAPGAARNGAAAVQVLDRTGQPAAGQATAGQTADCAELSGTITTRVGVVFGCADGALLATAAAEAGTAASNTADAGTISFERIPYPADMLAADRALAFDNRAGRPTVAAVAGDTGAWLLDTRERLWSRLTTDIPLLQVAAVDDTAGHVVALAADGRVLVLDATTGATLASTESLLPATLATDPAARAALLAGVDLTVDANRAYLNAPAEGLVYEIDYADTARIARSFPISGDPRFLAETGR